MPLGNEEVLFDMSGRRRPSEAFFNAAHRPVRAEEEPTSDEAMVRVITTLWERREDVAQLMERLRK